MTNCFNRAIKCTVWFRSSLMREPEPLSRALRIDTIDRFGRFGRFIGYWLSVRSGVRHVPMAQWAAAKKQQNRKLNEIYKKKEYIQNIGSGLASTISSKACMLSLGHTNSASQIDKQQQTENDKTKRHWRNEQAPSPKPNPSNNLRLFTWFLHTFYSIWLDIINKIVISFERKYDNK